MNPLEHHSLVELISCREQVCSSSEATFTLRSYHYSFFHYLTGTIRVGWWHHITVSNLSQFLSSQARERGLFSCNGIPVCLNCLTNEFVKVDKKLNGGDPTCTVCSTHFKGWGDESI